MQRRVEQPDGDREAVHRAEDALEVALLHGQRCARAPHSRPPSASARIISRTAGRRSSLKNMCSVRQRPMPSAPNSRARAASSGVSALARTPRRRISSAQLTTCWKSSLTCGGTSGSAPAKTSPVAPSMRDHVALGEGLPPMRSVRASTSTRSASQPPTQGLPMPRATTAAWTGHAAARREHALRGEHAVDVVGRRLPAHQDHAPRRRAPRARRCRRRTRRRRPRRRARRCRPARRRARLGAPGRSSGAAAGRAAPGRCAARASSRRRSRPRRPCRARCAARPARCACRCASAAGRACRARS